MISRNLNKSSFFVLRFFCKFSAIVTRVGNREIFCTLERTILGSYVLFESSDSSDIQSSFSKSPRMVLSESSACSFFCSTPWISAVLAFGSSFVDEACRCFGLFTLGLGTAFLCRLVISEIHRL